MMSKHIKPWNPLPFDWTSNQHPDRSYTTSKWTWRLSLLILLFLNARHRVLLGAHTLVVTMHSLLILLRHACPRDPCVVWAVCLYACIALSWRSSSTHSDKILSLFAEAYFWFDWCTWNLSHAEHSWNWNSFEDVIFDLPACRCCRAWNKFLKNHVKTNVWNVCQQHR